MSALNGAFSRPSKNYTRQRHVIPSQPQGRIMKSDYELCVFKTRRSEHMYAPCRTSKTRHSLDTSPCVPQVSCNSILLAAGHTLRALRETMYEHLNVLFCSKTIAVQSWCSFLASRGSFAYAMLLSPAFGTKSSSEQITVDFLNRGRH
jgi:hypothetical protein